MSAVEDLRASVDGIPRLSLRPEEAALAMGVSRDFFDQHIAPELSVVRLGRLKLYPVEAIRQWLEDHAERIL